MNGRGGRTGGCNGANGVAGDSRSGGAANPPETIKRLDFQSLALGGLVDSHECGQPVAALLKTFQDAQGLARRLAEPAQRKPYFLILR
jgi:hypothetical protein